MAAQLMELTGSRRSFDLSTHETSIGRGSANTIVLSDPKVSSRHARIVKREKGYYLEDLDSTNGTYFQNKSISVVHLRTNDTFRIGGTDFRFVEHAGAYQQPPRDYRPPDVPRNIAQVPPVYGPQVQQQPPVKQVERAHTGNFGKFVPWVAGGGVVILSLVGIFLFAPLYSVQSGEVTTCKQCGKEFQNTVHSQSVSFLDRDKYRVTRQSDYCVECGNQPVTYTVSTLCVQCGKAYQVETRTAPRRTEPRDESTHKATARTDANSPGSREDPR